MTRYKGLVASGGIAIGYLAVARTEKITIPRFEVDDVDREIQRYQDCRSAVAESLAALAADITERAGTEQGEIFEIQREFLQDPCYGDEVAARIKLLKINAENAVATVRDELAVEFSEIGDEYFSQRVADIRDLADRMIRALMGLENRTEWGEGGEARIIVANDLSPSETATMDLDCTIAFCTAVGGKTSHTAILSRSLGIPALVGLGTIPVESGKRAIVDAIKGELIVDPDNRTVAAYRKQSEAFHRRRNRLIESAHLPARTLDGVGIAVAANVANLPDAQFAREHGAEGIGLLRTEFLFLDRERLPTEEEQYRSYCRIAEVFPNDSVIVRTLDIGGDKSLPSVVMAPENNPFLGQRAMRLAFSDPERLLLPQLRAVLRAGAGHSVKLMFPMLGSVEELLQVRDYVEAARLTLQTAGKPVADNIEVGIMIEIPSSAVIARHLSAFVDFFSIGTNDLTQYTLAADRTNERVAGLADYFHPAVVSLIAQVVKGARKNGKWVGVCGEMAGDELAIPLLLGLGISELSMAGVVVPSAKDMIRHLSAAACRQLALRILEASTTAEVRNLCESFIANLQR